MNIKTNKENLNEFNSLDLSVSKTILFSTLVACLATLNAGFNIGVINIPASVIRCAEDQIVEYSLGLPSCLEVDDFWWGFGVGIFALGGGIGGLTSGKLMETFGRKLSLIILNLFFIIGGFLLFSSVELIQFAIGRLFIGIGSGYATACVSTYIGEITTIKYRSQLGSLSQFMMVVGILSSSILGLFLSNIPGWRFLLLLTIVPSIIQIILMNFCKETPRYLISKDKLDLAKSNLQSLRSKCNVEEEFYQLIAGYKEPSNSNVGKNLNFFQVIMNKQFRKMVIIISIIHLTQQFTGINSVIFYSTSILEKIFSKDNSKYMTVGINVFNFLSTVISLYLVDKLNRKTLLFISHIGMFISSTLLSIGSIYQIDYLVLVAVLGFVSSFALGLGPIPWMLMSEIFPTKVLSGATSIAISINWLSVFAIGWIFPPISALLNEYIFFVFAAISLFSFFFTLIFLPETKTTTVEEIVEKHCKP